MVFTQFEIVHHFQTQLLVGADGLVSGTKDKVERANANVVAGLDRGPSGTHGKAGHDLRKSDHHAFAQGLHVRGRKKAQGDPRQS